jgi:ATP-binding cassette subfamily B protein
VNGQDPLPAAPSEEGKSGGPAASDGEADGPPKGFTIDDFVRGHEGPRDWRQFPRLMGASLRLAWQAGRRELLIALGLQLFNSVAIVAQLLVGREVLRALLTSGVDLTTVVPGLAALVIVSALQGFAAAAEREQGELLSELVSQYAEGHILDVAGRVDLVRFESPEFFNRLQRAEMGAGVRAMQMVHGLFGLVRSVAGAVGVVVVLITLQPLLLPSLVMVALPLWIVTRRNSLATFRFFIGMTPLDRERRYLVQLFTDRQSAKEVRAFELAD